MERYKHLHTFEPDYWIPGFPIELEKGAILFDTRTQTVLLQLKFWNCSSRNISSVHLSINCFDDAGLPLGSQEFRYMDLQVPPHSSFGEQTAIPLTNSITRKVDISITRVVLDNSEVVEEKQFSKAKKKDPPQLISSMDSHYIEEMELILGSKLPTSWKFIPCETDESTWLCTCGQYNRISDSSCVRCGEDREHLLKLFSMEALAAHYTERITLENQKEAEALEAENARKLELQKKFSHAKKFLKKLVIALTCIAAIACLSAVIFKDNINNLIKDIYYIQATNYVDSGNYNDAIEKYIDSGLNPETSEEIQECYYQLGIINMNAKEYNSAISSFKNIDSAYKDTSEKIQETYYLWGKSEIQKGNYLKGANYLASANNYKDSSELSDSAFYYLCQKELSNKKYTRAKEYLLKIKSPSLFADYNSILNECEQWRISGALCKSVSDSGIPMNQTTTFSRWDEWHICFLLTTGKTDESVDLTIACQFPNGDIIYNSETNCYLDNAIYDHYFYYESPSFGATGSGVITITISNTGEVLGRYPFTVI